MITVIHPRLVLLERPLLPDRYVELGRNGVWCCDVTGLAVCPLTRSAIERAVKGLK